MSPFWSTTLSELRGRGRTGMLFLAVLFSVVSSRVFSTQYFIWLLALGAACLGEPRSRMRRCVGLLVAAGAAAQLVYPWLYTALLDGNPWALAVHSVRVLLVVAATALALAVLVRPGDRGGAEAARPGAASP